MLDRFSRFVTEGRGIVLAGTLLVTFLLALGIPRLKVDFTPSDLFAKFEDQELISAEFRDTFGNTDNILLVLVHGPDVLSVPALQHQHELIHAFMERDWAARVDGLTILPLPRGSGGGGDANQGILAAGYTAGAIAGGHLTRAFATLRGEPVDAEIDTTPPTMLLALASGGGSVAQVVEGDTVQEEDAQVLRNAVATSRILPGRLIARDGTLAAIAVPLQADMTKNADIERVVVDARQILQSLPTPEGYETFLGGLPAVRTDVIERMMADQRIMLPLAIVVCILILFASFRWVPAMVLPTAAVLVSALMLVGLMGWIGESFNILNNIIPLLIIIIGISNTIHLVNRYGEEIRGGADKLAAAREAVKRMTIACFLTSFTTAVGFGTLLVSKTEILGRFGLLAALGVLIAYIVTITFLPAALSFTKAPEPNEAAAREGMMEKMMEGLTRGILARPIPVIIIAFVIFGVAVHGARSIRIDSAMLDQFNEHDEIYRTTRLIEEKLAGVRPLEIYLKSDTPGRFDDHDLLNRFDEVAAWSMGQEGVIGSTSYADFIHDVIKLTGGDPDAPFASRTQVEEAASLLARSTRNPTLPYVNAERTRARLSISVRDFGAQGTIRLADALEAQLQERFRDVEGVTIHLTGDAYTGSKGLDAVISDLLGSLGLAVIIIFGFMALLFRSIRLAILSVPPNIMPLVTTMAFMAWTGVPLNAATAIIFSISIGMAVDGAIHILTRFREEVLRNPTVDEALIAASRGTGKAIIMTGLSLMMGFGVMLTSSFVPVRRFGELIAITVFSYILATIIVLPALLKLSWMLFPGKDKEAPTAHS